MKKLLILILALLVVLGAAYAYLHRGTRQDAAHTQSGTKTYTSTRFGYTLSYPAALDAKEYPNGDVTFGAVSGDAVAGVAEARVLTVADAAGQDFTDAAAKELANLCAADGPSTSFSCTGLESAEPFTAAGGAKGSKVYLTGELTDLRTKQKTSVRKGPYFVFLRSTGATGSSILSIQAPLNQSAAEADAATIEAIAKSVTLAASGGTPMSIEQFVTKHISAISPEQAQLGGTFYVTHIEAHGGAGTVQYEDGHNAYTADFTYSVDAAGVPKVDTFTVRK